MKIHFVGINGVSMRALADLVASRGHTVSGSDAGLGGHAAHNVDGCDLVVYTNAVPKDNCELARARRLGIPIIERAAYLGEISHTYDKVIAVAGCHGKSTATAMLGAAFETRDPTVHVGVAGSSKVGSNKYFITEACEYRRSFLKLKPDVGIILNIKYDHPDFYRNNDELLGAYAAFAAQCKTLIVNGDDDACAFLRKDAFTFGTSERCDYRAVDIKTENGYRSFTLAGGRFPAISLSVAGGHNVYNALAALAAAKLCGLAASECVPKLNAFCGIPRRFERKGLAFGKTIFTDYAHHPDEIAATIKTAREIFPSVAVVFQPHTYSRTQSLMDGFVKALSLADTVVVAPIFAAREQPIDGVSSHSLCRELLKQKENAYCFDTFSEIVSFCKSLKEKTVIFTGAGDIDKAADLMIACD